MDGTDYCYYGGLPVDYVTVLGMLHSFLHYTLVFSQLVSLVALALGGTGLFPLTPTPTPTPTPTSTLNPTLTLTPTLTLPLTLTLSRHGPLPLRDLPQC